MSCFSLMETDSESSSSSSDMEYDSEYSDSLYYFNTNRVYFVDFSFYNDKNTLHEFSAIALNKHFVLHKRTRDVCKPISMHNLLTELLHQKFPPKIIWVNSDFNKRILKELITNKKLQKLRIVNINSRCVKQTESKIEENIKNTCKKCQYNHSNSDFKECTLKNTLFMRDCFVNNVLLRKPNVFIDLTSWKQ